MNDFYQIALFFQNSLLITINQILFLQETHELSKDLFFLRMSYSLFRSFGYKKIKYFISSQNFHSLIHFKLSVVFFNFIIHQFVKISLCKNFCCSCMISLLLCSPDKFFSFDFRTFPVKYKNWDNFIF